MPASQTNPRSNLAWEALLDPAGTRQAAPLHMRLAEAIRNAVRSGRLPHGAALPPSRVLATDLKVSRWTVTQAYSQLITEGFLVGKTGSATRVNWSPDPDTGSGAAPRRTGPLGHSHSQMRPARYDLSQCSPDLRGFPRRAWVKSIQAAAETAPFDRLGYSEPGGEPGLRDVLADSLSRRRATRIEPELLTVFTGARHAMAAISRALVADGFTKIAVEDPGSSGLVDAARNAGLELVPLSVDEHGVVVEELARHPDDVRAISIGPAHQVVNGAVLSTDRRAWLLDWARRVDGLIIEDDYDSEFSYDGPPLPAMQGSDPGRVALLGSMSRTMTPTVNVGWVAAPRRWLPGVRADAAMAVTAPALNQLALAHFLESGAYDRHLRSSRLRFRARRDALIAELASKLPDCRISGERAGLHFVLELPRGACSAARIIAEAPKRGVELCDPGEMTLEASVLDDGRLQLGFGNLSDSLIGDAVNVLAELVHACTD